MYDILKVNFTSDTNATFNGLKQSLYDSSYTWIGIHIRRGDFLSFFKIESSVEYLTSAMEYYRLKYVGCVFVMVSDDKDWCVRHFGDRTDVIVTPRTYFHGHDIAVLALCEHSIVTAGTYGWWAGFLAGGDVIHDVTYPVSWQQGCSRLNYFPPWFLFPSNITRNHTTTTTTAMPISSTNKQLEEQADNGINQSIPKQLAYGEVQHNVFFFMVAGYETTAVTLAYCTYVLANYPKVQEKLQEEIDHHYHKENDNYSDYYIISNMEYMELFIKEVLRMFPVAISQTTNRQCVRETTVCGYKIAKGIIVQADVYSIHYDQELWGPENVNDFCPERHLIKRHPLAWLAFGAGPRICVGMRFALIEIKLLLMNLLKEYTIIKCEKLEKNFNVIETITIAPEEVWIKLEKRY
ncbi:unnamed protein product [Didymodactylos carnosus]|uniref:L-Fucosyltransferase n=1 Tax=Didymodactylos carnosus TaxID=1234261 RepID=A0A8S2F4F0_9BILA|nr:unnamed protein product [Didymodactylos carnosus]CAF4186777.1 unnamed protein product [Didymodactylos carnosus]